MRHSPKVSTQSPGSSPKTENWSQGESQSVTCTKTTSASCCSPAHYQSVSPSDTEQPSVRWVKFWWNSSLSRSYKQSVCLLPPSPSSAGSITNSTSTAFALSFSWTTLHLSLFNEFLWDCTEAAITAKEKGKKRKMRIRFIQHDLIWFAATLQKENISSCKHHRNNQVHCSSVCSNF